MKVDVYRCVYILRMRVNMKGNEHKESSTLRKPPKNSLSYLFVRVGINGFCVTPFIIPYKSFITGGAENFGAYARRGSRRPFKPFTYKRIGSNYARDIKPGQYTRGAQCASLMWTIQCGVTYSTDARFDVKAKFSFLSRWPWSFHSFPFRDTR